MKVQLEGITLLSNDVSRLAQFYRDVMGFHCLVDESHYAEFENEGVRLGICLNALMAENTNNHESFIEDRKGQAVELNFQLESPEQVHQVYDELVRKGATPITSPQVKSWGHTTGFFADPDGNIHSLFALNPPSEV